MAPSNAPAVVNSLALTSDTFPVIDFSALISSDPDQRLGAVHDLGRACQEWGFFILVNHGMPETLMSEMFTAMKEFYNLPESEKKKYEPKRASDPIQYGTFNVEETYWRKYLNLHAHPNFHCPQQPQLLREVVQEYSEITLKLTIKLMEGVCDALELDRSYVEETLKMDSSFQLVATNYYPSCPNPDQETGLPPHTDPGLFTILIHNGVAGLQIQHDGKWYDAVSPHNSLVVHAGDQLEILSNGKYKSLMHKAVVNEERERISVLTVTGPSGEAMVGPVAALVEKDGRAMYSSRMYGDYFESRIAKTGEKDPLEAQRIN